MDITKDHYATLGLNKDAGADLIKKAYRKLAVKHHPDKNDGDPVAKAKFIEVQEAYDVLSDEKSRKEYDAARVSVNNSHHQWFQGEGGFTPPNDVEDMWERFVGGHRRSAKVNARERAKSALTKRVKVPIMPVDVIRGGEARFEFQRNEHNGTTASVKKAFRVPIGIKEGAQLLFRNDGHQAMFNGELLQGDLIVMVYYTLPNGITLDEQMNAHCEMKVPYYDLILGGTLEVPLLEGGTANIKLSKLTDPDISLRLRGKGFPVSVSGPRADMHLHLTPKLPTKENAQEMNLLEQVKKSVSGA